MAIYMLSAFLLAGVGQSDVTLLYFTAEWCGPCAQMYPTMQRMHSEGWDVQQVDVDKHRNLVAEYRIENLPTVVITSGGQEVDRTVGIATYGELSKRAGRAAARSGRPAIAPQSDRGRGASAPRDMPAQQVANPPAGQPIVRGQSPGLSSLGQLAFGAVATGQPRPAPSHIGQEATVASSRDLAAKKSVRTTGEPPLSVEQAVARASAATVRIRVDEGRTTAHGTGTIIDVHGDEALVLTCGHLFRDMQPGTQLSVDLFAGTPDEVNLPSELIDFKANDEDIGLISFRLPVPIEPVEILPRGEALEIGQPAFSFGCDHGQDPSRRDTRITNINRYVGAANVEIAGAPAVGRSGGGLFDMQGRLIGVCNAADATDDEGIYAAADVVYDQIERIGLAHLFLEERAPASLASARELGVRSGQAQLPSGPGSLQERWPDENMAPQSPVDAQSPVAPQSPVNAKLQHSRQPQAERMICIFRDSNGKEQVLTIEHPSAELIHSIQAAERAVR